MYMYQFKLFPKHLDLVRVQFEIIKCQKSNSACILIICSLPIACKTKYMTDYNPADTFHLLSTVVSLFNYLIPQFNIKSQE